MTKHPCPSCPYTYQQACRTEPTYWYIHRVCTFGVYTWAYTIQDRTDCFFASAYKNQPLSTSYVQYVSTTVIFIGTNFPLYTVLYIHLALYTYIITAPIKTTSTTTFYQYTALPILCTTYTMCLWEIGGLCGTGPYFFLDRTNTYLLTYWIKGLANGTEGLCLALLKMMSCLSCGLGIYKFL